MTRLELIRLLIGQARLNGFEFRKWYTGRLGRPWESSQAALEYLAEERRYYSLIFSHEFASMFWKAGEPIVFQVPKSTFTRISPDGSVKTVKRKAHTRRTTREDVWQYHLKELALAEEPLRYLRRFLLIEDDLDAEEGRTAKPPQPQPMEQATRRPMVGSAIKRPHRRFV